jgi:hypothetical protein
MCTIDPPPAISTTLAVSACVQRMSTPTPDMDVTALLEHVMSTPSVTVHIPITLAGTTRTRDDLEDDDCHIDPVLRGMSTGGSSQQTPAITDDTTTCGMALFTCDDGQEIKRARNIGPEGNALAELWLAVHLVAFLFMILLTMV